METKKTSRVRLAFGVNRARQKWRIVLAIHPIRVMMLANRNRSQHSAVIICEDRKIVKVLSHRRAFLWQNFVRHAHFAWTLGIVAIPVILVV